jgi:hypothetical protein
VRRDAAAIGIQIGMDVEGFLAPGRDRVRRALAAFAARCQVSAKVAASPSMQEFLGRPLKRGGLVGGPVAAPMHRLQCASAIAQPWRLKCIT